MNANMGNRFLCLIMGFCVTGIFGYTSKFKEVFKFKSLDFDYPTPEARQHDIDTKTFIPGVPAPIDMDVHYSPERKKTIFVTIPRFQAGIPVTLGTIIKSRTTGLDIIKPYPAWNWHQNPEACATDRLVSVYRVKIDTCGRLWVLDTGRHLDKQVCAMQILAFDLNTNRLVHRHIIDQSLLESRSILVTPIVDIRNNMCSDAFVYIADCQTFSVIIHDVKRDISWRATDKTMYPYPNYGTFKIQGEQFDLMDGVLGMDVTPIFPNQDRKLIYSAMSAPTENWVLASDLRNQSLFEHDPSAHPQLFHTYKGTRPSQSAALAIDNKGIAFFGLMTETTVNCWNTATEFGPSNIDIVEYNPETLQFASGVKVINGAKGKQELWVLTSRFQKVATGSISENEVNFRIQAIGTDDAVAGKRCKSTRPISNSGGASSSGSFRGPSAIATGGYGLASPNGVDKYIFSN